MPNLEAHVDELAADLGVTRSYSEDWWQAASNTPLKRLVGPRAVDPTTYYINLHELGHLALKHKGMPFEELLAGRPGPASQAQERNAWEWAFANAIIPPDEQAKRDIAGSLGTYLPAGSAQDPDTRELVNRLAREGGGITDVEARDREAALNRRRGGSPFDPGFWEKH